MGLPRRFVSLASAAAIAAGSAQATQSPVPWKRVGAWEVALIPGRVCLVWREFAGGTLLRVSERDGRGLIAVSTTRGAAGPVSHRMSLVVDGERRPFAGRDVLNRGEAGDEWGMAFESSLVPVLSAASALEMHRSDGTLQLRLDLDGIRAALAELPTCHAKADGPAQLAAPPPPPAAAVASKGKQRPPKAQANLASLFSADDYPEAAWQAGEEGAVGFRLRVGKAGQVSMCEVTSSSGSAELDSATCRLIAERARFTPARDAKGRLGEGSASGRIVWRIPEPEPPEPPPP